MSDGLVQDRNDAAPHADAGVAIRVRGLVNQFGAKVVHDHLDLDVRTGEVLGVIGPSGCGKSVLLRSIVGLIRPKEADIEVFGVNLTTADRIARRRIEQGWGVMFQDGALFSMLTVRENVMAPMREHLDLSPALMRELADMKVVMVGLEPDAAAKRPAELSGGMKKRAALARALALDPKLLFLDEPTAGLDPISAGRFDELLRALADALGLTVFLVTHDLDTLGAVCDRVCVLQNKNVLAIGTLEEVRADPDPWIQEYFSGPRGRAALG